jgi:hypothetical protein
MTGKVEQENLTIILQATGLDPRFVDKAIETMGWKGKNQIEFLDFMSYIPFFVRVHNSIVGNVLKNDVDIDDLFAAKDGLPIQ